jgi:hypothetical protein
VGNQSGDETAVSLRLEVAHLRRLLDRRHHQLLVALLRAGNHLAVVRCADFLRDFLAPVGGDEVNHVYLLRRLWFEPCLSPARLFSLV